MVEARLCNSNYNFVIRKRVVSRKIGIRKNHPDLNFTTHDAFSFAKVSASLEYYTTFHLTFDSIACNEYAIMDFRSIF